MQQCSGVQLKGGIGEDGHVHEAHADAICDRLTDVGAPVHAPISDDFVLALRAEATDGRLAVSAALPLTTVAANLGELELLYPTSTGQVASAG